MHFLFLISFPQRNLKDIKDMRDECGEHVCVCIHVSYLLLYLFRASRRCFALSAAGVLDNYKHTHSQPLASSRTSVKDTGGTDVPAAGASEHLEQYLLSCCCVNLYIQLPL